MFGENREKIHMDIFEEEGAGGVIEEEKSETMVTETGEFEKPFHLEPHTQEAIREHFLKKGYEIIEMTDAHVKVKSSGGKTMTIENEVAAKYFVDYR